MSGIQPINSSPADQPQQKIGFYVPATQTFYSFGSGQSITPEQIEEIYKMLREAESQGNSSSFDWNKGQGNKDE